MQLTPKTKANELLDEIMLFTESLERPSEFEKARLVREIGRLKIPVAKDALSVLLEFADESYDVAERMYNDAVDLHGYDTFIVRNYIYALGKVGQNVKQFEILNTAAESSSDISLKLHALGIGVQYADLPMIEKYLQQLSPLAKGLQDNRSEIENAEDTLRSFNSFFESHNISQHYVNKLTKAVLQLIEKSHINFVGTKFNLRDEGFFDVCYGLDVSIDKLLTLNDELVDIQIDQDLCSPNVVFRFEKAQA